MVVELLRQTAAGLLEKGEVRRFLGFRAGRAPWLARPAHVDDPARTRSLVWNHFCGASLAKYLLEEREREGRVGLLVKACDARAVERLVRDRRVERDQVMLVGVACPGMIDPRKLGPLRLGTVAEIGVRDGFLLLQTRAGEVQELPREEYLYDKCYYCEDPNPSPVDLFLGETLPPRPARTRAYAEVAEIKGLPLAERTAYWDRQFSRCLRCFACRNVCPACSCRECCFDSWEPRWLYRGVGVSEQYMFHFTRAFHVAGRCVDCWECERVCPVGIPLMKLNHALQADIRELFGADRPWVPGETEPLAMYAPDDPDFH